MLYKINFYSLLYFLLSNVTLAIQREIDQFNYGLDILICGVGNDEAHIYAIINPGTLICYDNLGLMLLV